MTDYTETEVKVFCPDLQTIQNRLEALGATLIRPRVFEHNVRYENTDSTLTSQGIVVRLRQDDRIRLTYKDPGTVQNGILSRYEAEVEISDLNIMSAILIKLGYTPFMNYEKYRTTYTYHNTEVVLDELPYGAFIEIEGHPKTIEEVLKQLNLSNAKRFPTSYIGLFNLIRQQLDLSFQDLTFDNFQDIQIPEDMFQLLCESPQD